MSRECTQVNNSERKHGGVQRRSGMRRRWLSGSAGECCQDRFKERRPPSSAKPTLQHQFSHLVYIDNRMPQHHGNVRHVFALVPTPFGSTDCFEVSIRTAHVHAYRSFSPGEMPDDTTTSIRALRRALLEYSILKTLGFLLKSPPQPRCRNLNVRMRRFECVITKQAECIGDKTPPPWSKIGS